MKSIEIVTHCWSGKEVPIYHHLLKLQLSSIRDAISKCDDMRVSVTVCYSREDYQTVDVLSYYKRALVDRLIAIPLHTASLFRRAIGRNIAAKTTQADVVWFTDCDYLFTDRALREAYGQCCNSDCNIVFPNMVMTHAKHEFGDQLIQQMRQLPVAVQVLVDYSKFAARRNRVAIGGVQIVKGSYCIEHGYLANDSKYQTPVATHKGFQSCRCDVPFRKRAGPSQAVPINGVYRIRHSRCGRDGGTKDHSK